MKKLLGVLEVSMGSLAAIYIYLRGYLFIYIYSLTGIPKVFVGKKHARYCG